jgi:hypothetical protein
MVFAVLKLAEPDGRGRMNRPAGRQPGTPHTNS